MTALSVTKQNVHGTRFVTDDIDHYFQKTFTIFKKFCLDLSIFLNRFLFIIFLMFLTHHCFQVLSYLIANFYRIFI